MYHMVCEERPGATFNKLRVAPERFEAQLRWLSDNGWQFAFMSALEQPDTLRQKTVILTFDDGYEDNLLAADPLLVRFGACATLYLVEDRFERDWSTSKKAHHDSGELMREAKLSDEQVEGMLASGRWELGGHTRTHANLARLTIDEAREEIGAARTALQTRFATRLGSFAYPFGIYAARDVELTRVLGYKTAVTTREGIPEDLAQQAFELPRIKVSGKDSLLDFRLRLKSGRRSF